MTVKPRALNCPNCGSAVEFRGFGHAINVVCPSCLTVLDATNPQLVILQQFEGKQRYKPEIPLGSRGTFDGGQYEAIGFQVREVESEGTTYHWAEYLLFNPYKGFRYLSAYQGHWNYIRVLSVLLEPNGRVVEYGNRTFKKFDQAIATTSFVLGEFPWRVRVGETVTVEDYISPPMTLASERTDNETTWSLGEYKTGQEIYQAFKIPGSPDPASGTYMNQPSPMAGKAASAWRTWMALMAALIAVVIFFAATAARREVLRQSFSYNPSGSEAAVTTNPFDLTGRPSDIELTTTSDLKNDWLYLNFGLVNQQTEKSRNFGRELVGSKGGKDRVIVPSVPSGKYYLRIEPDKRPGAAPVNYQVVVRRDVPTFGWFWLAAILLSIWPLIVWIRSASFEAARWRESDYS